MNYDNHDADLSDFQVCLANFEVDGVDCYRSGW